MNVATQDHLASKTFYCFETVHKVIKNSNGLCQKSIQRRRGKERTEGTVEINLSKQSDKSKNNEN